MEKINHPYNETYSSAKAKGTRLRKARMLTFLGVTAFAKKHNFVYGTLKSWEHGLHGGLPLKRADEIIQALKSEGIVCSHEWLIYGSGRDPYHLNTIAPLLNEEQRIHGELEDFYQNHPNAIHLQIADNEAYPHFQKGDVIAGIKNQGKEIIKLENHHCIVQVEGKDHLLLRNIRRGTIKNHFHLHNINHKNKAPIITNAKLISAAPIIWLRRKADYFLS